MTAGLEELDDAAGWARQALAECLAVWARVGRRYARRLEEQDRLRDAAEDVLTLAARRVVRLPRPVMRPLPPVADEPLARAFEALDRADRYVLTRLPWLGGVRGARGEHLASALERLTAARRRRA